MKLRFRAPTPAPAAAATTPSAARPRAKPAEPAPSRAARNRIAPLAGAAVALWHRHGGRPALIGLALLGVALALQWGLQPSLRQEETRLEARQRTLLESQRLAPGDPSPAVSAPPAGQELPPPSQRGRDLERLVTTAARHGLGLDRADYALGAASRDAVVRVEASLPLTGTYSALRQFVASALNELPHAALESLQIERPNTQSAQLQATAKLVLFYRQEGP